MSIHPVSASVELLTGHSLYWYVVSFSGAFWWLQSGDFQVNVNDSYCVSWILTSRGGLVGTGEKENYGQSVI